MVWIPASRGEAVLCHGWRPPFGYRYYLARLDGELRERAVVGACAEHDFRRAVDHSHLHLIYRVSPFNTFFTSS